MIINESTSYSDIKTSEMSMKKINSHYQGGGKDKQPWTACPPPLQLRVWDQITKKAAQFDLNYD